jgi:hypothetical protein
MKRSWEKKVLKDQLRKDLVDCMKHELRQQKT